MTVIPFQFFTGKGGVGKTSLSCAYAVQLADLGYKVLIVSTDPASNLSDVLDSEVREKINSVNGVDNLYAININPEKSAQDYRNRVIKPLEDQLPDVEIDKIKEELSGACTTEIASFDEFSRFISGEHQSGDFDVVIFDTAPTGHTLRLLELPAAWTTFTEENPYGASCLGPTSALKSSQQRYREVLETLKDKQKTIFHLVAKPDISSLKEASRTSKELIELGLKQQDLLINGVFTALNSNDPLALKMEVKVEQQLKLIPDLLKNLPLKSYPLLPYNILGIEKLRSLMDRELQNKIVKRAVASAQGIRSKIELRGLEDLVEDLIKDRNSGLIMTMGKGGVGKTIVASAIAVMIAKKGFLVHLTTTDPAAHVQDFINQLDSIPENFSLDRIDPKEETRQYIEKVLSHKGKRLDAEGRKLLREDLKSPCTEEVAVFHAFSKAIQQAKRKFVVVDTAPTGHTLLLLDTAGSYHKEVLRGSGLDPSRIKTPFMFLQDKSLSKIILVALPETTPMREAAALQSDLKRAGIKPFSWLINQSLSVLDGISDPLLLLRSKAEESVIEEIEKKYNQHLYAIPFLTEENLLPALLKFYSIRPTKNG